MNLNLKKLFIIFFFFIITFQTFGQSKKTNNERTLTCEYCGKTFKQKKVTINFFGEKVTGWEGGAKHCDPNYYKDPLHNAAFESDKSKYCSRKCACDSGEE